ncbi:MAG TPA: hypothetical protein VIO14_03205 [Dehalococcoidia bacterium]
MEWVGPRGPWKVITVAYWYSLEDLESREVLAYHWHPNSGSPLVTPHLHLGTAYAVDPGPLVRCHLPTGRVAVEDVIRLAIELGARPLQKRWERILDEGQAAYEQWRTRS